MGCENDPVVFTTFRKLLKSASTILLLGFVSILIINLVFANQTLI